VAPITLPPLHQRRGDILPLAQHFLQRYAQTMGLGAVSLAPDARAALLAYNWPGNIRELENVIHYALIVCAGGQVRAADLNLAGTVQPEEPARKPRGAAVAPLARLETVIEDLIQEATPDLYEKVEEVLVRTAFAWCDQNQVQTARALGITRNVVRTQLKRFGLLAVDGDAAPGMDELRVPAGVA
jgi:sigma-54-specific transcriptional regulator